LAEHDGAPGRWPRRAADDGPPQKRVNDMTAAQAPPPPPASARRQPLPEKAGELASAGVWRRYIPAAAGVAYLAAWIAGLSAWPANLAVNAAAGTVAAAYRAHAGQAAAQYLLAEGIAGVLLGVVAGCLLLSRRRGYLRVRAWPAALLAAAAAAASVAQYVIGLLVIGAATHHDVARAGALYGLVNRMDGVKMLALAGTAAWLAAVTSPAPLLPRWLRAAGTALAVSIFASGLAYLALSDAFAWTAFVSGPLLLLWVTGTGIWLSARPGFRADAAPDSARPQGRRIQFRKDQAMINCAQASPVNQRTAGHHSPDHAPRK
jgi:hypothetical protein